MAKNDFVDMRSLQEEQKKLEKKMRKIRIPCSHTKSNGKLKVRFINGNLAQCERCGTKFDFGRIEFDKLEKAVVVVHNAVNQIKAFSNDPEKEAAIINSLGNLDFNLQEVVELYRRTVETYGKGGKKNKNRNNNDDFGSYGVGSIGFVGGKKDKKRF